MTERPDPIRTNTSNHFAHHTMTTRIPNIIQQVIDTNPDYPPRIQDSLHQLNASIIADDPITMIDLPAPDYDQWAAAYQAHQGDTWLNTEWFYAEVMMYRQMLQAVHWWQTRRDPFAPQKLEAYTSASLWDLLDELLSLEAPPDERMAHILEAALWGNRLDLSHAASAGQGNEPTADDLLADDRSAVADYLLTQNGDVHLVADNAGTELTMDLVLADALLNYTDRVTVHLKMSPIFVSDAIVEDVWVFLDRLQSGMRGAFGERLRVAVDEGRLILAPDFYWNGSTFLWDAPDRVSRLLNGGGLVILKGDANYRRALGDAIWPTETPLADALTYLHTPVLALRTLKSDPLVGLPEGTAARLDQTDDEWRTNGQRGIIQFADIRR
jgi:uncharacterized protein with ATP-grasp and redox domains